MNKSFLIPGISILLIFVLLLFSGCSQPITPEKTTEIVELKADESIVSGTEMEGPLNPEVADWPEGDCTSKITSSIDMIAALITSVGSKPDANEEEKAKLEQTKQIINEMKKGAKCTFTKTGDRGTLTISFRLSKQALALIKENAEKSGQTQSMDFSIEKTGKGTIKATISRETGGPGTLKLKAEGEIINISPDNYTEEGEYLVFKELPERLSVEFKPNQQTGLSFPFTEFLPFIIIGAIIIAIIIVIIFVLKRKKPKTLSQTNAIKQLPQQTVQQKPIQPSAFAVATTAPPAAKPNESRGFFSSLFKGSAKKNLFDRKRQLLQELKIAEQRFLRRKISEETYQQIVRQKQQELIKIDAQINRETSNQKIPQEEMASVAAKEKHLMQELLEQKQGMQKELEVAQKKYLKREIDEKTYKSVLQPKQQQLIEIEAKIKSLSGNRSIKSVFAEIKQQFRATEELAKEEKRKELERIAQEEKKEAEKIAQVKENERKETERVAQEILEQVQRFEKQQQASRQA